MELFANDIEIPIERTQEYWDVSAELITLVVEIEAFVEANPGARADEPDMLQLRHRLRSIGSRFAELSLE